MDVALVPPGSTTDRPLAERLRVVATLAAPVVTAATPEALADAVAAAWRAGGLGGTPGVPRPVGGGAATADDVEVAALVEALAEAGRDALRAARTPSPAERRFRALFEGHPLSMQVFDPEGRTLAVNPAWERTFGMTPDQLGAFNPLRDPQLADVRALLARAFDGETVTTPPHPFRAEPVGGGPRPRLWLEVSACPVHDEAGAVCEVILTHHDVTASEAAALVLGERERLLAEAQRLAGLGCWTWEVAADRVTWSDELFRIYGLTPSTFGASFEAYLAAVHPDDRARVQAELGRVLEAGGPFTFEERIVRPDGEVRHLRSSGEAQRGPDGRVARLLGVCYDVTEQKAAEAALRASRDELEARVAERTAALAESEASYRGLFETLSELVCVLDLEGRLVAVNEAVVRAHGMPREAVLGQRPDVLCPPTLSVRSFRARFARAVAGEPQRFEWQGLRADGTAFPLDVALQRSTYFGRDVVIAVGRDVTDRVEAEAALREREEHFRRLIENASDLIQIITMTGEIAYSSPSVERLLGYAPEAVAGTPVLDYVHPADQEGLWAEILALFAEPGVVRTTEFCVRHHDGRWRHLEARGQTMSPTSPEDGFVVNARDITERVEAEAAVRQSEEHFRRLTENASDMIQIVDAEARILYTGPSVERLLGYTPAEIEGTDALSYLCPDDVPGAQASLAALAAAPGSTLTIEYRVRHKDGRWRSFEANCRTLAPTGPEEGFVVNARDVTERVEAAEALRRARERLAQQEKLAGLGRLAAGIAHELKNPLNFVVNFAALSADLADDLGRALPDAPDEASALLADLRGNTAAIAAHGRRADAIVRGMMEHARDQPGARGTVDVNGLVAEAVAQASQAWAARHGRALPVALDLAPDAGAVEASARSLARAVANLVANALDAVAARPDPPDPAVTVRTRRAGGRVEVAVADGGPGIAEAVRATLFEPFVTTKPTGDGHVGLGLSLARDLVVEGHGGTLEAESRDGEGATFTVSLPAA